MYRLRAAWTSDPDEFVRSPEIYSNAPWLSQFVKPSILALLHV
jgi:hypothetical protein